MASLPETAPPRCLCCPDHGVYVHPDEVQASAAEGSRRQLVTYGCYVLDVAKFAHPGGDYLLTPFIGSDITEAFEEAGHSSVAERLMRGLCLGRVGLPPAAAAEQQQQQQRGACCCSLHGPRQHPMHLTDHREPAPGKLTKAAEASAGGAAAAAATAKAAKAAAEKDPATDAETDVSLAPDRPSDGEESNGDPHSTIDFSKPLVPQIYRMNMQDYKRAVHTPYCQRRVFRLMPWDWMEPLTKTFWWMVPLFWLPVILYLSYSAIKTYSLSFLEFFCLSLFGLFVWSLLEYGLHRFLFHYPEERLPDFGSVRVVHFVLHAIHHMLPMDPLRLVMPPALLLLLSVVVYVVVSSLLPRWVVWGAWPGGLVGYLCYDMIHYSMHHVQRMRSLGHLKRMQVYHLKHHFKYPHKGFGVSSKSWDIVFGTLIEDTD